MTRTALPADLFTRPPADLDDVAARIGTTVAFIAGRTVGKPVPPAPEVELGYTRNTLDDLAAIKGSAVRAKSFRAEHGVETLKDPWFAITDHGTLLGLHIGAEVAL